MDAVKRDKYRKELFRLIQVYAWLTALLEVQEPNIRIRRKLEDLEAVVFRKKRSVAVEMSREDVQAHWQQTWEQIESVVDLLNGLGA